MSRAICTPTMLLVLLIFSSQIEPMAGENFESVTTEQHRGVQQELMKLFPESEGYIILGSLDFCEHLADRSKNKASLSVANISGQFRLICGSIEKHSSTNAILSDSSGIGERFLRVDSLSSSRLFCFIFESGDRIYRLWGYTSHSMRKNIWDVQTFAQRDYFEHEGDILKYTDIIGQVLANIETGDIEQEFPVANLFNLPEKFDFYAPPPDYVIQGYQNYKDFMRRHAQIKTDFAHDVYEIRPHDSLLEALKAAAPGETYPNKEAARLQHEFKKFFERGGKLRHMNTLTTAGFDTLKAGEYFFAVSLSGRIRFGRELLREEVDRIETKTGKKVPRANHAFLFPGEEVLTAGAFFIKIIDGWPKIISANAGSGHYFYSNISPTIREDIKVKSDHYLLTLGHFFNTLDRLQISYRGITISKF